MSEVKKLRISSTENSLDGEYVRAEHYAELKAQRDALADENAALKSAIAIAKEGLQEHYDTDGVDSQDSEGNFVDACIRLCDAQSTIEKLENIPTPATDAWLNSVRAEGVQLFAAAVQGGCAVGDRVKDLADSFAAQLRAGEPS